MKVRARYALSLQRRKNCLQVIEVNGLEDSLTGGEGGIRTPDRGVSPYNGLANRRLQPLGHLSVQIKNGKNECDPTLSRSSLANSARDFGCGLPLRLRLAHARKTPQLQPLGHLSARMRRAAGSLYQFSAAAFFRALSCCFRTGLFTQP